jgi:hypothetical protein
MCSARRQIETAIRLAVAEARYRHFDRKTYIAGTDSGADDAFLAFADQAVAEAEMRETEARFALDEHAAPCRHCSINNSN